MIVINFKTYKTGKKALILAKKLNRVSKRVVLVVPAPDIYLISSKVKNSIFAEHVDYFEQDRHTGAISPEDIKSNGANGSLINHSEKRLTLGEIGLTIRRCKKLNLKTIVCTSNLTEAKKIDKFKPDFIAYEPPELIAGNISVSQARPDVIEKAVKQIKTPLLVGAGIKNKKDLQIAKKLGAKGILISSAIIKDKYPEKILRRLLS